MSCIVEKIKKAIENKDVLVTLFGLEKLAAENISIREILESIECSEIVEEYKNHERGHCVLLMQFEPDGEPIHVFWSLPKNEDSPAILVFADRLTT